MGKHMSRSSRVAAALLALWAAAGAAEEQRFAALPTELDIYGEVPVVLTASRLAQPLDDAPAAVTVIDRELIRLSGAREIVDLFRLVPGFLIITDNAGIRAVTLHGLADVYSRRFQVLVDGRSVYLPSLGGVAWTDLGISLDEIERIEIIRGPNAAAYGANAFLGAINIITRHGAETVGDLLRARGGEDHIRDGYLRIGRTHGDLDWRLVLGRERDTGFEGRPDTRDIRFLSLRMDWQASATDRWMLKSGLTGGFRQDGRIGRPGDPPRPIDVLSHYQHLRWSRAEGGDELMVQLYHQTHRMDEEYTLEQSIGAFPLTIRRDSLIVSQRWEVEVQRIGVLRPGLRTVLGASSRLDRVRAREYLGREGWLSNRLQRVFATVELAPRPRWTLHGGLMVERDDISGTHLSPRLSLNLRPHPLHTIRLSVSRGYRKPLLAEEYGDGTLRGTVDLGGGPVPVYIPTFRSSGGLDSERIISRELGYVGRFKGLTLDLRLFLDRLDRLITSFERPVPLTFPPGTTVEALDFANRRSAEVQGAELGVSWRSPRWRMHGSYAYTRIEAWGDAEAAELERSAPQHVWSLLVSRRLPEGWRASATYYFIGAWKALGFADPIGAVRRLDLRLERSGGRTHPWRVALVAQNLLDTYPETRYRPGKGPNFFDTRLFIELVMQR